MIGGVESFLLMTFTNDFLNVKCNSLGVEPSYILMCSGMLKLFSKIVSSETVKDYLDSCLCEFWLSRSVY